MTRPRWRTVGQRNTRHTPSLPNRGTVRREMPVSQMAGEQFTQQRSFARAYVVGARKRLVVPYLS